MRSRNVSCEEAQAGRPSRRPPAGSSDRSCNCGPGRGSGAARPSRTRRDRARSMRRRGRSSSTCSSWSLLRRRSCRQELRPLAARSSLLRAQRREDRRRRCGGQEELTPGHRASAHELTHRLAGPTGRFDHHGDGGIGSYSSLDRGPRSSGRMRRVFHCPGGGIAPQAGGWSNEWRTGAGSGAGSTEFETAIGRCAIAWQDDTIVAVRLPGTKRKTTSDPPAAVQSVIDAIVALLDGERVDLSWVRVDMSGEPEFNRRVYEAARTIPVGSTATYGDIAGLLGSPHDSRAVGKALARNPFAIVVPCHRRRCGRRSRWVLRRRRCAHEGADARHRRRARRAGEPVRGGPCPEHRLTARPRSARCGAPTRSSVS